MIYAQWRPEGGFDLYESNRVHPIGDDLPSIDMPAPSGGIGVPAQDVGQPLPSDARFVGTSDQPQGIMVPMLRNDRRQGIGQAKTSLTHQETLMVLMIIGMLGAAAWASRNERGRA